MYSHDQNTLTDGPILRAFAMPLIIGPNLRVNYHFDNFNHMFIPTQFYPFIIFHFDFFQYKNGPNVFYIVVQYSMVIARVTDFVYFAENKVAKVLL